MSDTAGLRVLLIEDNELDARVMTKSLGASQEPGFRVTRVGDLASALELLASTQFDCLLLDLSLPDSSGLMSVEVLAARAPDCPIVVLTGLDDPSTAVEAVERGAQDYLSKQHVDRETIARSIRYAVARLHSEVALRSATDQLTLLRDRERIARDLHDTVIQQLFATGIGLQSALSSITDPQANQRVLGAVESIDSSIRQLRETIFGLHTVPQNVALANAIDQLADDKADALGFLPIVEVGPLPEDLSPSVKHEALQLVSESLSNVAKHAEATACKIIVGSDEGSLTVIVTDNGRGIPSYGQHAPAAFTGRGLLNMQRRATELGGRFDVGPGPGGGTKIEWRVPFDDAHPDRQH